MQKSLIALALVVVGVLVTLNIDPNQSYLRVNTDKPATVPYVDIAKYGGAWYEQSVIPFYFERGCSKTIARYSLNPDGKSVKVDNSCVRNGKLVESVGKAIPEDSTNAKLKVEFVTTLDIGAQYWIVRLGSNYEYSVVSSPDYKYLWILYR
jgi:apolipoprotein D and lipocalin family protein